jgi:hypothetical protein
MELVEQGVIKKNGYELLYNKDWLFPETGKAGFHYNDVNSAVKGLIEDLRKYKIYPNSEELIKWIEKWFPDIFRR